MAEYVVFIALVGLAVLCYVLDQRRPQEEIWQDPEALKLESPIERRLYDALKSRGEFVRTQVPCGKYRIDIALPGHHIAIECDGEAYHSTDEQIARDRRKNAYLRANGWRVLRFSGKRISRDLKGTVARIESEKEKSV
jgi:very-short-patch-repair endonuclease